MAIDTLTELIGFPGGWLVGVSYALEWGYQCWVITPERQVHTDGEFYESSLVAMGAGRFLVEHSLEVELSVLILSSEGGTPVFPRFSIEGGFPFLDECLFSSSKVSHQNSVFYCFELKGLMLSGSL